MDNVTFKDFSAALMDPDFQAMMHKALTTATGSGALFDNVRDSEIADETDKRHMYWANLRKTPGEGAAALLSRKTDRANAAAYVAETGQASSGDATYNSEEFDFKVVSSVGEVGTKLVHAGRATFGDLEAIGLADTMDDIVDIIEEKIITGLGTGNEILGVDVAVDGFDGGSQAVSHGVNGGQLDLTKLDESADLVRTRGGIITFGMTSDRVRRELNAELQAFQRFVDKVEIKGGFRVLEYDNYPVMDSSKVVDESQGSATDAHRFTHVDTMTGYWIQELLVLTPFQLARTKASSKQFEVLGIHAGVHKNRRRLAQAIGIIP